MQVFYLYYIHWQCEEGGFISHQKAAPELEFGSRGKILSKAEPPSNKLLLTVT